MTFTSTANGALQLRDQPEEFTVAETFCRSENGVRLAQRMQVGPCVPVEIQL